MVKIGYRKPSPKNHFPLELLEKPKEQSKPLLILPMGKKALAASKIQTGRLTIGSITNHQHL